MYLPNAVVQSLRDCDYLICCILSVYHCLHLVRFLSVSSRCVILRSPTFSIILSIDFRSNSDLPNLSLHSVPTLTTIRSAQYSFYHSQYSLLLLLPCIPSFALGTVVPKNY